MTRLARSAITMPEKPEVVGSVKYSDAITPLLGKAPSQVVSQSIIVILCSDWSFTPAEVSQVVSCVVASEAELSSPSPAHHAWYDSYCLLVSDYLSTATLW